MTLTKRQVRHDFYLEAGELLWQERRKQRQTIIKAGERSNIPKGVIDRFELGRCRDLHRLFSLCAYYNKKIKIELVDN